MPPVVGFTDNPFENKDDVRRAAYVLLQSLRAYQSPGGARIRIPVSTGAHFDETASQLEGYARPLWVIGALLADPANHNEALDKLCAPFVHGLASGTDPSHPEYWGPVVTTDQRMVEMEIISFALLAAPSALFHGQTPKTKANIISWLREINGKPMPGTNWLWFRVMTNLALIKVCGLSLEELHPLIDKDLNDLDSYYLKHGWSSDGAWSDQGRQADYYSGSFAIQFSQLLYARFASDIDPARCAEFYKRARSFAIDFFLYFNDNGAAIPFGRSLTYRFAFAGFWSAAAFAEVELPHPLDNIGVVKGLLLRHLRWWSSKSDMFNVDGTLSIGFAYPNMFMCEDYNSPQSVYWCMKTLIVLGLPSDHTFWTTQERSIPTDTIPLSKVVRAPRQIVCNSGSHHFLLSAGQFCPWPLKATEAKYGKFAYSSHFAFSVPTGPLIQQIAPDSTLALSVDGIDDWKVRWIPLEPRFGTATLVTGDQTEEVPVLLSSWKPWSLLKVQVSTALIAPSSRWPNWHIRVHNISADLGPPFSSLSFVEGGFAIYGRKNADGLPILPVGGAELVGQASSDSVLEAAWADTIGCFLSSIDGASGIRQLNADSTPGLRGESTFQSKGVLLKPDSNTNLMRQRTVIPTIQGTISLGTGAEICSHLIATGVYATTKVSREVIEEWNDPPVLHIGEDKPSGVPDFIKLRW